MQLNAEQVRRLRKRGTAVKGVLKIIGQIPPELNALYEKYLLTIDEDDKPRSLQLMQWIYFALRPLSLGELRFAMAVDTGPEHQSICHYQNTEHYVETDEDMEKQVRYLSTGLAEVVCHENRRIVQFINKSVNDFLFKTGFQLLGMSHSRHRAGTPKGHGHFRLSRSCIKYLAVDEVRNLDGNNTRNLEHEYPFLEYATFF